MPSLKEFVDALTSGWFPAIASFVGCAIVLAGDHYGLPYLSSTPQVLLTTFGIIGAFSFAVLVANVAYLPVMVWKAMTRRRRRAKVKAKLVREIEMAPEDEKAFLRYLVTSGRRVFVAEFNDHHLTPLVTKGFLARKRPGCLLCREGGYGELVSTRR